IGSTKQNTVVSLTFKDGVPERAEHVLDELIAVYNKATLNDKKRMASATLNFLNERLAAVKEELNDIENKEKNFRSSEGAVELSTQAQQFIKSTSDIDTKTSEVQTQMNILEGVEKQLKNSDNASSITTST